MTAIKNLKNRFNENGYLIIKNFYSKKKCDNFLKVIKKYANSEYAPIMNPDRAEFLIPQIMNKIESEKYLGEKANLIKSLEKDCNFFRSAMVDKKLLNILKKIKKKKVSALMSQMIFKEKKTKYSKQSWLPHQDNSYPMNRNGEYITINIFMEDSTVKNGTLYILENSHKNGILKFTRKISYREKDCRPGNTVKDLSFKKRDLTFKKGDMLVLHGNLVHGSYPNKSNKSRPLYSVSYIPTGEKFIAGLNAQRKLLN